jgi:hypothetical protein
MATTNKKINVTTLDFDDIKTNLKTFLSGQTEFQDYDFEGSAMSILLDVLAYNTHYNALYNNLAINEMFLDSARKRNSVVSISKMLGYSPRSATCSKATITLTVTAPTSGLTTLSLPAFTPFTTTVDGESYIFYTLGTSVATSTTPGVFIFPNLEIVEGSPLSFNINVGSNTRYIIPNVNIDLNTLTVRVQDAATSSVYTTFTKAETLVDVNSETNCYWVKEIDDSLYEITFGDNNLGHALEPGNVVHLNYFVSNLDAPNKARLFTYGGNTLISGASITVTTVGIATNGAAPEDIDSIRFNAPRMYASQNRAVTPDDYKAIVYSLFSDAASVTCWGGEDNNPPVYGKVYLCVKPKDADKLTTTQKAGLISTILQQRNVVSVQPVIVDPEYINIALTTTVYYNEQATTKTASEIAAIVTNTINAYDVNELNRFDGVFRYSKLSKLIDNSDPSITNNITTVLLRRELNVRYNVSAQYILNLINPIWSSGQPEESFRSTGFYVAGSDELHYLDDDGVAHVRLFRFGTNGIKIVVNPTIGNIDYTKGVVDIKNLHITALADIDSEISIRPLSNDVVSALTQIATVAQDHLKVVALPDPSASGDLRGGYNYTFTSSRS